MGTENCSAAKKKKQVVDLPIFTPMLWDPGTAHKPDIW